MKPLLFLSLIISSIFSGLAQPSSVPVSAAPVVLLRCDDAGMCRSVNLAIEEIALTGLPFSTSIMVTCPWYLDAIEIVRRNPQISPGIHLVLNSEWRSYRWGPVSGAGTVPSLVDSTGHFHATRDAFFAHHPKMPEIERELRAQIERARSTGLRFDYLDYHMGTAVQTPELRAMVERLAGEYGLGISRYFGEVDGEGIYRTAPGAKGDTLAARIRNLTSGPVRLFVFHVGRNTEEMQGLIDVNAIGLSDVASHRDAERQALLSAPFRSALQSRGVHLTTYRELIRERGLDSMKRPD